MVSFQLNWVSCNDNFTSLVLNHIMNLKCVAVSKLRLQVGWFCWFSSLLWEIFLLLHKYSPLTKITLENFDMIWLDLVCSLPYESLNYIGNPDTVIKLLLLLLLLLLLVSLKCAILTVFQRDLCSGIQKLLKNNCKDHTLQTSFQSACSNTWPPYINIIIIVTE